MRGFLSTPQYADQIARLWCDVRIERRRCPDSKLHSEYELRQISEMQVAVYLLRDPLLVRTLTPQGCSPTL